MKFNTALLPILFIFLISSTNITPLQAQSAGEAYTMQKGDWLSNVANKAYGDSKQYKRIVAGTNEKALTDKSYQAIENVNDLKVGQKVWIPGRAPASTETPTERGEAELVAIPKTNCEIRVWYNYQVVAIGELNKKWEKEGMDVESRAKKAYHLRHDARVNARFLMQNKAEVKVLQDRDMAKYGNPDGPTFDYLFNKSTKKGLSATEAYQSIIASSSRVSPVYNSECE